jgi:methyl-accepting chemotaxis protein
MNITNLKIGVRLGLAFAIILALFAGTIAFGIFNASQLNAGTNMLVHSNWVQANYANDALDNARGSIGRVFEIVAQTDPAAAVKAQERLQANTTNFNDALNKLEPMLHTDASKSTMEKVKQTRARYVESYGKVLALLGTGDRSGASKLAFGETYDALHAFADDLREMVDIQKQHFEERGVQSNATYVDGRTQMIVLGVVAVMLGLGLAFWITRSITRPINEAVQIAETVASGDLTRNIVVTSKDETGQLISALKVMNDSLVKIVGEVRTGTEAMSNATAQIATGNMDLSSRTEMQAGALEETSSSMEQLTSTVKQNADHALQANQLAQTASQVAIKGGTVVTEVVSTMVDINESSKKIVDIISVIDGIAFQTNILALNAAVEAARAGEQGRGFAVVAAEVRNLAQRSAGAAKEIKALIGDSVDKVDAGTRLVDQAGVTMNEIVDSIKHVTDIVSEITAASREQSTGIDQINTAIIEMDHVTQQNAALVEEAAAAASSLQDQSGRLLDLVSVFKLNAAHMAAPAAPAIKRAPARISTGKKTSITPKTAPKATPKRATGSLMAVVKPTSTSHDNSDGWEEF